MTEGGRGDGGKSSGAATAWGLIRGFFSAGPGFWTEFFGLQTVHKFGFFGRFPVSNRDLKVEQ